MKRVRFASIRHSVHWQQRVQQEHVLDLYYKDETKLNLKAELTL